MQDADYPDKIFFGIYLVENIMRFYLSRETPHFVYVAFVEIV